jgi:hypothetical protein
MFAFGLVVAQEEGTTYFPMVYEYPNGNTMTNDIKLNTYYFYAYELQPLHALGEWGFIAFKQGGGLEGRGYLNASLRVMKVTNYPDYLNSERYLLDKGYLPENYKPMDESILVVVQPRRAQMASMTSTMSDDDRDYFYNVAKYRAKVDYYDEIYYYWFSQGFSPERSKELADNETAGRPKREATLFRDTNNDGSIEDEKTTFRNRLIVDWIKKGFNQQTAERFANEDDGADWVGRRTEDENDDTSIGTVNTNVNPTTDDTTNDDDDTNTDDTNTDDTNTDDTTNDNGNTFLLRQRRSEANNNTQDGDNQGDDNQGDDTTTTTTPPADTETGRRTEGENDDVELTFTGIDFNTLEGIRKYEEEVKKIRKAEYEKNRNNPKINNFYFKMNEAKFYWISESLPGIYVGEDVMIEGIEYIEVVKSYYNYLGATVTVTAMLDDDSDNDNIKNNQYIFRLNFNDGFRRMNGSFFPASIYRELLETGRTDATLTSDVQSIFEEKVVFFTCDKIDAPDFIGTDKDFNRYLAEEFNLENYLENMRDYFQSELRLTGLAGAVTTSLYEGFKVDKNFFGTATSPDDRVELFRNIERIPFGFNHIDRVALLNRDVTTPQPADNATDGDTGRRSEADNN